MHAQYAALRRVLQFGDGVDVRSGQTGEGGQIFVTLRRGMSVFSTAPLKTSECVRYPVKIAADNAAGGVGEREVDEEEALGAGHQRVGKKEDALRAIGGGIDSGRG